MAISPDGWGHVLLLVLAILGLVGLLAFVYGVINGIIPP
jgi:hypothetical protein